MTKEDIKSIRERAGLTQEEFAVKIGKSLRTVQHYEKGVTVPNAKVIEKINLLGPQNVAQEHSTTYYKDIRSVPLNFNEMSDDQISTLALFIEENLESLRNNKVFSLVLRKIKSQNRAELILELADALRRNSKLKEDEIKKVLGSLAVK